ncbi:hypothetical protein KSF73_05975 [Burkholderiaceae bacterium DAT-1]|nr:hypothetical protein [Burkholderiaceae bacterium DAT-1]
MKSRVLMLGVVLLAGCGSYESDIKALGPEPVPEEKEGDWRLFGQMKDFDIKVSYASIGPEKVRKPKESPTWKKIKRALHIKSEPAKPVTPWTYVWVLRTFKEDQKSSAEDEDSFRKEFARFAIDCESGKMAGVAVERWDKDDDLVIRRDIPGYSWEFSRPLPGTFQENFYSQVCKIAATKHASDDD